MHTLVAFVSGAIVVGLAAYIFTAMLGDFAVVGWIVLGFFAFMGLMAKINDS